MHMHNNNNHWKVERILVYKQVGEIRRGVKIKLNDQTHIGASQHKNGKSWEESWTVLIFFFCG